MHVWGKIIGGLCGLLVGGAIGLIIGVAIGHWFDRGLGQSLWHGGGAGQAQAQQAFFDATFLVMGHIAKADGRVSEAEIENARNVMRRLNLNETLKQRAIQLFNQGKQPDFNLDQTLLRLTQACHRNRVLLRMFLEIQFQAVLAEGTPSAAKQRILQQICQRFGIPPLNFAFFNNFFNYGQTGYQQQGYQRYSQQGSYSNFGRSPQQDLNEAYSTLGITASATDAEVKRAYRRLMSQHHPDKLVSKGLPEEMIKLATEKTQTIKAAYEQICAVRGIG